MLRHSSWFKIVGSTCEPFAADRDRVLPPVGRFSRVAACERRVLAIVLPPCLLPCRTVWPPVYHRTPLGRTPPPAPPPRGEGGRCGGLPGQPAASASPD